jgi:hypothetical protein
MAFLFRFFACWHVSLSVLCLESHGLMKPATVSHVEAGWNTSTIALRVVEGDEKGTHCLGL